MKKTAPKTLRFTTAGYSVADRISVDVGPCLCGSIGDGVAFWHDDQGAWLIDYADLMAIADAATKARKK